VSSSYAFKSSLSFVALKLYYYYYYYVQGKAGEKTKLLNTMDKWCSKGKNVTTGLTDKTKTVPSATCSKPHDVDGFSFDSLSDDDLVSAVNEVEGKCDDKSKANNEKAFHETVSDFPGQGYILGASSSRSVEAAAGGPIVRRIPGIGIISARTMSAPGRYHAGVQHGPYESGENKSDASTTSPRTNTKNVDSVNTIDSDNKIGKRGSSVACDLSDSDEDFDKLLASHRSRILSGVRLKKKKKVSATEFTSVVFGNSKNKQGSIVNVANFMSVSSPKANGQKFSDKDQLSQVRNRVLSTAHDEDAVSETRPTKRLRADDIPDKISKGTIGNNNRSGSVAAWSNPATAAAVLVEVEDLLSHSNVLVENNNSSSVDNLSNSTIQLATPLDTSVVEQHVLSNTMEADNTVVKCPICYVQMEAMLINIHLDDCLAY